LDAAVPPLEYNGGQTETKAPLLGSPAINQVPLASCPASDQVGNPRPDAGESVCDIGAFETGSVLAPSPKLEVSGLNPNNGPQAGMNSVISPAAGFSLERVSSLVSNTATNVTVISATSITATAPPGTGTVDVTVTDTGGTSATSAAARYTYNPPSNTPTSTGTTSPPDGHGPSPTAQIATLAMQLGLPSTKAYLSLRKLTIHIADHVMQSAGTAKIESAEVLLAGHVAV
jgi:hypothetical protein